MLTVGECKVLLWKRNEKDVVTYFSLLLYVLEFRSIFPLLYKSLLNTYQGIAIQTAG